MDDIKIFTKNEKELESLIKTIRNFIQDIVLEFEILKFSIQRKRKKRNKRRDRTAQLGKYQNPWRKEKQQYLEMLQPDTIK